jgi:hypothetical protein
MIIHTDTFATTGAPAHQHVRVFLKFVRHVYGIQSVARPAPCFVDERIR